MTTYLEEVPGARERPGGCPIMVSADGDKITLTLPPRGISPVVFFFACVLLGNLLVALYTGLMLLLANKSVLGMAQIAPGGLPVSLRHEVGFLLAALGLAQALGFFTLAAILRPVFFHETLHIDREWLHVSRWDWGRMTRQSLARTDISGFDLRRVPPGLDAGRLTIQGRGMEVEIGECLRETDREWLASVGNALLSR
jgi:uncharacterized membrane protein